MYFIFSTPVFIRHLWQLKTVVFLHWCLICAVLLMTLVKAKARGNKILTVQVLLTFVTYNCQNNGGMVKCRMTLSSATSSSATPSRIVL